MLAAYHKPGYPAGARRTKMLILRLVLAGKAAACMCARDIAVPAESVGRAGQIWVALNHSATLSGDPHVWQGVSVTDLHGDSMAGMFMPPHLSQSTALTATVGLPVGFAVSATLPYLVVTHLGQSEMPGDVDSNHPGDTTVQAQFARSTSGGSGHLAAGAGVTLPTGKIETAGFERSGRGTLGLNANVSASLRLSKRVAATAMLGGSMGVGPDITGFTLGPAASLWLGPRYSPDPDGRITLAAYGIFRYTGTDQQDGFHYRNTGTMAADIAGSVAYEVWDNDERTVSLQLRLQAPIWQVIGDPMYAENFVAGLGVHATVR